jgi:hypothetical protein
MIEFLAQMPTDTMIFLTMAVLGLAAVLMIVLRQILATHGQGEERNPSGCERN